MTDIDNQLNKEFNKSIINLENFLKNFSEDINNLQIDKNELNSLSSLISDLQSTIENLSGYSTVEEE
tara:strand:+ start:126 stop:326 length:201 start_codon:yes stop_codon:yes gene_type:complete